MTLDHAARHLQPSQQITNCGISLNYLPSQRLKNAELTSNDKIHVAYPVLKRTQIWVTDIMFTLFYTRSIAK